MADYSEIIKGLELKNQWEAWQDSCEEDFLVNIDVEETRTDMVNHPAHYTRGNVEVIDIIEDAIADAPGPKTGMLQAQVLKYLLRMWLKGNAKQDAEKAKWYLERLIDKLNE